MYENNHQIQGLRCYYFEIDRINRCSQPLVPPETASAADCIKASPGFQFAGVALGV